MTPDYRVTVAAASCPNPRWSWRLGKANVEGTRDNTDRGDKGHLIRKRAWMREYFYFVRNEAGRSKSSWRKQPYGWRLRQAVQGGRFGRVRTWDSRALKEPPPAARIRPVTRALTRRASAGPVWTNLPGGSKLRVKAAFVGGRACRRVRRRPATRTPARRGREDADVVRRGPSRLDDNGAIGSVRKEGWWTRLRQTKPAWIRRIPSGPPGSSSPDRGDPMRLVRSSGRGRGR